MTIHRPVRAQLMLEIAHHIADRSTCQRSKVGTVITNLEYTQIYSYGYNGNYAGGPNTCDSPELQGRCGCIHSEVNALVKAPYLPGQQILITTMSPCLNCSKLIINAGIGTVVFGDAYRTTEGLEILHASDVTLIDGRELV